MNTLILSCNTGEGHNACARAIKEYFEMQGEHCVIADSLAFTSESMSKFISDWHVRLYRHMPTAFGLGYGFAERHPSTLAEGSAAYKVLTHGRKNLYNFIKINGFDNVICTHVFSAMMVSRMREKFPIDIKTSLIHTDYTIFPGTTATDMDIYFIPHSFLEPVFINAGIKNEKLVSAGIPVKQGFYSAVSKEEAKRSMGLDVNKPHIIMMSGSMGCGPVEETAAYLANNMGDNCQLSIVCGTNTKMKEHLEKVMAGKSNVHVLGFVQNVSLLLDSADLYFTKPGGISTSEAAKKRLPMVFIQAVGGCETHNFRFFTGIGAAVSAKNPRDLAQKGLDIIATEGKLKEMSEAYSEELSSNGSEIIYNTLKK